MRSECGDTSGRDNSSCGIYEGFLSASDTPPKNRKTEKTPEALNFCPGMCIHFSLLPQVQR